MTFTNVVLRYGFNTGLIWGLEMVSFLFAWLVLFGISYAVKVTAHLGVDAIINLFRLARAAGSGDDRASLCASPTRSCCLKALGIIGHPSRGWMQRQGAGSRRDLQQSRDQGLVRDQRHSIARVCAFLKQAMNQGEEYEKLPRFIPYAMLPFGMPRCCCSASFKPGVRIVRVRKTRSS